jgi:hypothetical protein
MVEVKNFKTDKNHDMTDTNIKGCAQFLHTMIFVGHRMRAAASPKVRTSFVWVAREKLPSPIQL